jgi:hypothetical protein
VVAGDELRKDGGDGTGPGLYADPTGRPEEGSESRNPVGVFNSQLHLEK